jgi:hypothetical protein
MGDAEVLRACVKVARERGTFWHKLSFEQQYQIRKEVEASMPKPVPPNETAEYRALASAAGRVKLGALAGGLRK